ncbi:MAG: hypothetical protein WAQ24_00910 [Candidatus Saccharimonadales bacterium]
MSEVASDYQWWSIEPPCDDDQLPYDYAQDSASSAVPMLDGTQAHALFENPSVIKDEHGLRFEVPRRLVDTLYHGKWTLTVFGRHRWFKDIDEYGATRFTTGGKALWVPHLYPFEETDQDNLPLIRDRERCSVTVQMTKYAGVMPEPYPGAVEVVTNSDTLTARESPDSYNPYGNRYFTEFKSVLPLILREVTFPELQWPSYSDYYESHPNAPSLMDVMDDKAPMPKEFTDQFEPNDWRSRKRVQYSGAAFGTIWVPVEDLWRGKIAAQIRFPMFLQSNEE